MEFILWILLGLLIAPAIKDTYEWEKFKRRKDDDDNIIGGA